MQVSPTRSSTRRGRPIHGKPNLISPDLEEGVPSGPALTGSIEVAAGNRRDGTGLLSHGVIAAGDEAPAARIPRRQSVGPPISYRQAGTCRRPETRRGCASHSVQPCDLAIRTRHSSVCRLSDGVRGVPSYETA